MKWAAQRDPSGDGPRLFHRSMSRGLERGDGPHDHPVGWCPCCFVLFCVIFFPRCGGARKAHFSKGVPGFWDRTAIPDSGFQVQLFCDVLGHHHHCLLIKQISRFLAESPSPAVSQRLRESPGALQWNSEGFYCPTDRACAKQRTLGRLHDVGISSGFSVWHCWEELIICQSIFYFAYSFRRKKEQMKIANKNEKYSERLLFHGTRSSLVDEVCHRNFDFQEFDASAYGKGMFLLQVDPS